MKEESMSVIFAVWLVMIMLKMTGYLTLGWLPIITFPLWIPLAIIVSILAISALMLCFVLVLVFLIYLLGPRDVEV